MYCASFPRLANTGTCARRSAFPLLAAIAVVAVGLTGCGSKGVRYDLPITEQYEQIPLLRPPQATTYSVEVAGHPLIGGKLAIEGMSRVSDGGDLRIIVDYQGATATPRAIQADYVCVARTTTDANGKPIDLTRDKHYQRLGFREPIISGPLHLVVSYWIDGAITLTGNARVTKPDGTVLSTFDLSTRQALRVGKPVDEYEPFTEVDGAASVSVSGPVSHHSGASLPNDPVARRTHAYLEGTYADYQFIARDGFHLRSAVVQLMDNVARTPDTTGKQAAALAWQVEATQRANNVQPVIDKALWHLNEQYASGPRRVVLPVAEVQGNPAVTHAVALISTLVERPISARGAMGTDALLHLDAGLAALAPEDIRVRAAMLYDRALVQYLLHDLTAAQNSLYAALAENAKESDSIFNSAGKDHGKKIRELIAVVEDRIKRQAPKP